VVGAKKEDDAYDEDEEVGKNTKKRAKRKKKKKVIETSSGEDAVEKLKDDKKKEDVKDEEEEEEVAIATGATEADEAVVTEKIRTRTKELVQELSSKGNKFTLTSITKALTGITQGGFSTVSIKKNKSVYRTQSTPHSSFSCIGS